MKLEEEAARQTETTMPSIHENDLGLEPSTPPPLQAAEYTTEDSIDIPETTAEVVDPEYDTEELSIEDRMRQSIERKSQALLEIMQAGAGIEAAISTHMADIDDTMLELLKRRIEAARQLERRDDVIKGMMLLLRRLKAEVDRKAASPAMRLLDSLLALWEEQEVNQGDDIIPSSSQSKEARQELRMQIQARLRTGFGAAPMQVDVVTMASQLAASGQAVADDLMQDLVDPQEFIAEVSELFERVGEQQRQLEQALAGLPPGGAQRAQVEQVIAERAVAMSQIEQVLEIALSVKKQL